MSSPELFISRARALKGIAWRRGGGAMVEKPARRDVEGATRLASSWKMKRRV